MILDDARDFLIASSSALDAPTVDLIEELAFELDDKIDLVNSLRDALSVALEQLHLAHVQLQRSRQRHAASGEARAAA
jgi:hypothetical protein